MNYKQSAAGGSGTAVPKLRSWGTVSSPPQRTSFESPSLPKASGTTDLPIAGLQATLPARLQGLGSSQQGKGTLFIPIATESPLSLDLPPPSIPGGSGLAEGLSILSFLLD